MKKFLISSVFLTLLSFLPLLGGTARAQGDSGGGQTLQEYIDALPYGIEEVVYGTDPGCVGDEDAYNAFSDAYAEALRLEGSSASAEEQEKAIEALKTAKDRVEEAINPVRDGLYYIITANSVFSGKDTMAWYAPMASYQPGWKKKETSMLFMWRITRLDGRRFSIQNLGTGQYVNHCAVIDGADQPLMLTDGFETAQRIRVIAPNGEFYIQTLGANFVYNIQNHQNGEGVEGPIASWTEGGLSSESTWKIVPVSEADQLAALATEYKDKLGAAITNFISDYPMGTEPGYYSEEAFDTYYEAYNEAQTASSTATTEAEYKAAFDKLNAAKETFLKAVVPITDGYYALLDKPHDEALANPGLAWSARNTSGYPYAVKWDRDDPSFVWRIQGLDGGKYSIQNYMTKEYVNTTNLFRAGASISLSAEQTTAQTIASAGIGAFTVGNPVVGAAGFSYAMQEGQNIVIELSGTKVYLAKYSDEDVETIMANYGQKLRDDSLKSLIAEATPRTAIDGLDTIYTIDYDSPVVTDKSQLFMYCQSTQQEDIGALIDGDLTTYVTSAWNDGVVEGTWVDDYHALRIDAGEGKTLPQNLVVHWIARHNAVSGYPNLERPTEVRFYASNDLENWDLVKEISGIPTGGDWPEYTTPVITLGKPYRYINMKVIETNNHSLYYGSYVTFNMAEYNAYPVALNADTIYTANFNSPVVTKKSQLYMYCQSSEQEDLGALIDGDLATYVTSAWNSMVVDGTWLDDCHALRIDAGEGSTLPDKLVLHWVARHNAVSGYPNLERPTDVRIYASNDLENWFFLTEISGIPTEEGQPEYTTPVIALDKPYRYINMKVVETNNHSLYYYGNFVTFNMSEYNAYPVTGTPLNELEIGEALDSLRTAIDEGRQKVGSGNVTSRDIADFRAVYDEYLLTRQDTSDLHRIYALSAALAPTVEVGTAMFCYPQDKASALASALEEVDAARPFTDVEQREIARLDTMLTRAYNALVSSIIGPEPGVWYTVYSKDGATTDAGGNTILGQTAWMGGNSASDSLGVGSTPETYALNDPHRAWTFEPTGTPNVYNMVCAANGWPINHGPVRLVGLGDGQFAIYTGANLDRAYYNQPSVLPGVANDEGITPVKDGAGAWAMEEAPATLTYTKNLNEGSVTAMVLPFDTRAVPVGTGGESVKTYSVCGYTLADDGRTVTGINLAEWTEEGIKAGIPFVVVVEGDKPYNDDATVSVDFSAKVGGTVSQAIYPQNGLYGTFDDISLQRGMVCFDRDSAYVEPVGFLALNQSAYLNTSVASNTGATVAKTIPVSGTLTVSVVGITPAIIDGGTVSVYTIDGVLVRKDVKASEAVKGLNKGIYIVGTKKVLVR